MMRERGIALLLVAHTTKPRERKGWTIYEMAYAMLGSSAAPNWARSASLLLARDDGKFELLISKGAEWTGLEQNGHVVRRLFLRHSGDRKKPYWHLCSDQKPPLKVDMKKVVEDAARKFPELSQTRLAHEVLRISSATVSAHYPEDLKKIKKKKRKKK